MLKPKTTLCALAIAGIMTLSSVAAAQALPDKVSKITEVQGISEYRLANGLQVLLFPDNSKPTVTVSTTYRVGSRMENYGETGMAHLLEHLTFKGTKNMANVGQELSKRGIGFNGQTGPDDTKYYETFPAAADTLDWVLGVEAQRMTSANIAKADLDSEMTVVRNEMESGENSPSNILSEKMAAAAYQWHSYGRSTIGARSDVENVNIAHLQNFYRRYYQPDNATLVVAGKFDPAQALATIARDFGSLPRPTRVLEPTYTEEPVQEGERAVTLRRPGGEQWVGLLYHIVSGASADMSAFDVIASALGDDPNGRLYKRLIETRKAEADYVRRLRSHPNVRPSFQYEA
ncbi:MAG: M16 family metallopeptidase [Rudaea sp.]